jgi:hypothetical protein
VWDFIVCSNAKSTSNPNHLPCEKVATFFEILLFTSSGQNAVFDPESKRIPFAEFHTQLFSSKELFAEDDLIWMHAPSVLRHHLW